MDDENMTYRPTAIKIKRIERAGHVECIQISCFCILFILFLSKTPHCYKNTDGVLDNVQKDNICINIFICHAYLA
jgi:hypothetical protein